MIRGLADLPNDAGQSKGLGFWGEVEREVERCFEDVLFHLKAFEGRGRGGIERRGFVGRGLDLRKGEMMVVMVKEGEGRSGVVLL